MNEQIKQQWIEALRSGEYSQTQEQLRDYNGYCCLGVLCDLYSKANDNGVWRKEYNMFHFETHSGEYEYATLPKNVSEWAGLGGTDNPIIEYNGGKMAISDLNDMVELSFNQIAAVIREQL